MLSLTQSTFAFAPVSVHTSRSTVRMEAAAPEALSGPAFAETLPGITAPFGFFVRATPHHARHAPGLASHSLACALQDPVGLTNDKTSEEILMFREAELAHGRVSMVAGLGFLVQENFHPSTCEETNPRLDPAL